MVSCVFVSFWFVNHGVSCIDLGLCSIYEQNKKVQEYTVSDVVDYFKSFEEIMFLEYDDRLSQYTPRDADWISQAIARLVHV